ncbi:mannosyltransferase [Rhizobium sp. ACO-34A]|nr:glycosyltransferase family 4 protein [Rhizobium sp. ACO-34A]ATN33159.1 mannosyltransferase [Rhizobium sp. ACO-34A]
MRILLTTYHQAFLTPAGGETELHQLAEFLSDCGARADIYGPNSRRLSTYDVVIHFSTHGAGEGLLSDIKSAGKPIVLLPNFNFFDQHHQSKNIVQRHLDLADLIVLRTQVEKSLCEANFNVADGKLVVIPPGIAPAFGKPAEEGLFQNAYGLQDYVLWVGQLAEHKRQLEAIEALADLEVPLVMIGGYADKRYYERCKAAVGDNVRFLPNVQPASEILRSAMQSCSAYLELGDDFPGFSAIEAALAGRPMVLNEHPWSREIFGDAPVYVAPGRFEMLHAAILDAIKGGASQNLAEQIKAHHLQPNPTKQLLHLITTKLQR